MAEQYRSYCQCCSNFAILRRYCTDNYFCHRCSTKITTKLKKLGIDPLAAKPDKERIMAVIDDIITSIESEVLGKRKQRRDFEKSTREWHSYVEGYEHPKKVRKKKDTRYQPRSASKRKRRRQ